MSLLINNSEAAERARGLIFSENFESRGKVVQNNGVITGSPTFGRRSMAVANNGGSPTQYVTYNLPFSPLLGKDFTILCRFRKATFVGATFNGFVTFGTPGTGGSVYLGIDNTGSFAGGFYGQNQSTGVAADSGEHVLAVTKVNGTGSVNRTLYLDGVAKNTAAHISSLASSLLRFGTIEVAGSFYSANVELMEVKIFNRELSAQEIVDYSAKRTFQYDQSLLVNLKMDSESHDPTGIRTLDSSGKGNHARFGDGSTASTYPTKISGERGYVFDGGDYLSLGDIDYLNSASSATISMVLDAQNITGSTYLFRKDDGGTNRIMIWYWPGGPNWFLYAANAGTQNFYYPGDIIPPKKNVIITCVYDGNNADNAKRLRFYVNGVLQAPSGIAAIPTSLGSTAGFPLTVGGPVAHYGGRMKNLKLFKNALTDLQVNDLYIRTLKELNRK